MSQIPNPAPIIPNGGPLCVSIRYERRYSTANDITHDEDHIHDFYEIYVNLCGDVSFLVEDNLYKIQHGDIIVTAPNELHRCIYHSDCIHEHFCIWFKGLYQSAEMMDECFKRNTFLVLSKEDKERLIDYCFGMYKTIDKEGAERFHAARNFFGILDMICSNKQEGIQAQNLPIRFSEIVDYISLHYSEPTCSVEAICEKFFISKSTLLRRFRQYFQTSPSAYIEAKRFSESKKLLIAGHSVQDACFLSGFSDCSYFIMRFRKKFGMTPYKYQKEFMEPVSDL